MVISLKVAGTPLVEGDLDNLVSLTFLDSKSLLPAELVELGEAFGVELKGNFDQKRKNRCRTFDDFEAIRYELLKYNKLACLVLFQVLVKFSELIYNLFSIDLKDTPTLACGVGSQALKNL